MRCYGFDRSGRAVVDAEAAVIVECAEALLAGATLRAVTTSLRNRGIRTAAGNDWTSTTLSRLLCLRRLAGIDGQPESAPAVISVDMHLRLYRLLNDSARRVPALTNERRHLLSGDLLICGKDECGKPLYGHSTPVGKRSYVCSRGAPSYGCNGIRIAATGLESEIRDQVLDRLVSPLARRGLVTLQVSGERLRAEAAGLAQRSGQVAREFARGEIPFALLKTVQADIEQQQKRIGRSLQRADRVERLQVGTSSQLRAWWDAASIDDRHEVVRTALDHVVVGPATRRGPGGLDRARLNVIWH
jgi:Recombinase/Recombinase zinc beta ribbon domain